MRWKETGRICGTYGRGKTRILHFDQRTCTEETSLKIFFVGSVGMIILNGS